MGRYDAERRNEEWQTRMSSPPGIISALPGRVSGPPGRVYGPVGKSVCATGLACFGAGRQCLVLCCEEPWGCNIAAVRVQENCKVPSKGDWSIFRPSPFPKAASSGRKMDQSPDFAVLLVRGGKACGLYGLQRLYSVFWIALSGAVEGKGYTG
jgi:hypothetical protein